MNYLGRKSGNYHAGIFAKRIDEVRKNFFPPEAVINNLTKKNDSKRKNTTDATE